jgi:hypothetical protein
MPPPFFWLPHPATQRPHVILSGAPAESKDLSNGSVRGDDLMRASGLREVGNAARCFPSARFMESPHADHPARIATMTRSFLNSLPIVEHRLAGRLALPSLP